MIKIESTSRPRAVEKSSKKGSPGTSDGITFASFLTGGAEQAEGPGAVTGSMTTEGADAVFAVQTVDERAERRAKQEKAVRKGEDLLENLEHIQLGLLNGSIPKATIVTLAQAVRAKKDETLDPNLLKILDEIELRVEVELEKLANHL